MREKAEYDVIIITESIEILLPYSSTVLQKDLPVKIQEFESARKSKIQE